MNITREFIRDLPKAELHVHIEGTLEPELMFELAARNSLVLPFSDVEAVTAAYQFTDLQSFLDILYQAASVLLREDDFYRLMLAYLERANADGVRRAEIFFDPQTHTARGVGFDVFMPGFLRATKEAGERWGLSTGLILCILRHLPESDALATVEAASPYRDDIIGIGLDSSENGYPPSGFVDVYRRAEAYGWHKVAHAGEEGPPAYIWSALDDLGVERIDHGVRAVEDPRLVARLRADKVPLTMCPLSNQRLQVTPDLSLHPLKDLLDEGVIVTINSDDPAYFGGYVLDNYLAVTGALELNSDEVTRLAQNSLTASFLSPSEKERLSSAREL